MKAYSIIVRETLEKIVCVEAENLEDARNKVGDAYRNVEIILEPECIVDTEFIPSIYTSGGDEGEIDEDEMEDYKHDYQWI